MSLSKRILLVLLLNFSVILLPLLAARETYAQTARVYFEPTPLLLEAVGSTGTVEVILDGIDGLSAFDVKISYDTSVLQVDGVEFSSAVGGDKVGPKIDNELGEVSFGSYTFAKEADGSFVNILDTSQTPIVLASITVTAVGEGGSVLSFSKVNMLDTAVDGGGNPLPIAVAAEEGSVQVSTTPEVATTFSVSPPNGSAVSGTFTVNLDLVGLNGKEVSGADVYLNFEPAKLEALAINTTGGIFDDYPLQEINSASGKIGIGAVASSGSPVTTEGKIATITFKTLQASGTTTLSFDYTPGSTIDSNITEAGTGIDILTEPPTITYTFAPTALMLWEGWNKIVWPANAPLLSSAEVLSNIDGGCGSGTALAVSRNRNGWWESYRAGYGGVGFNLTAENFYYILASKDCAWEHL